MIHTCLNMLGHHRDGLKALKKIHQIDAFILPLSVLQSLLAALLPYLELYISTFIIDALIRQNYQIVPALILALVLLNLLVGLLVDLLNKTNTYKADKVQREMIKTINQKAMELDYEAMEDARLLQKISDSVYIMEHIGGYNVFVSYYRQLVEYAIKIVTSFVMIFNLSLLLPIEGTSGIVRVVSSVPVSFGVIMLMTVANLLTSRYISKLSKQRTAKGYQEKMKVERMLAYYTDQVFMNDSMGKDIRLFDMLGLILHHYGKAERESIHFYGKYYFDVDRNKETFQTIFQACYTLSAYVVVMFKVLAGAISIGELSKYIGSISILNQAIADLIDTNQKIALQTEFIKTFHDFLDAPNAKARGTRRIHLEKDVPYCIEFHHVSFRYRNSDSDTLRDVSCKIKPHSQIAIVGKNGAGKTTFIKLICRLYEPTEGSITLNGVDIREYHYEDYVALFSVVFQDFQLFSFPIVENVAVGKTPNRSQVWECLNLVGLADSVRRMPHQIDTNLFQYDQDGVNMSGGESQKLAIARALYKDAPMVILDEPTAALDPVSEYEIFASFNRLVKGKTSMFISHRMGSCRLCEEILVFDDGKIVQQGSHDVLMQQQEGLYAALYLSQANYYEEIEEPVSVKQGESSDYSNSCLSLERM